MARESDLDGMLIEAAPQDPMDDVTGDRGADTDEYDNTSVDVVAMPRYQRREPTVCSPESEDDASDVLFSMLESTPEAGLSPCQDSSSPLNAPSPGRGVEEREDDVLSLYDAMAATPNILRIDDDSPQSTSTAIAPTVPGGEREILQPPGSARTAGKTYGRSGSDTSGAEGCERARKRFRRAAEKAKESLLSDQDFVPDSEPRAVRQLAAKLNSTPTNEVDRICDLLRRLGETGSPTAIGHIRDLINRRQADVRSACASSLADIVHSSSALSLLELLDDRSPQVAQAAIRALAGHVRPGCLYAVVAFALMNTVLQPVLQDAINSLHEDDRRAHVATLRKLVKSRDEVVSAFAIQLLSNLTGAEYAAAFSKLVGHSSDLVREAAVRALGRAREKRAIGLINAAMTDEAWRVRAAATSVLAELHSSKSIDLLLKALHDSETRVRRAAAKVLSGIEDPRIGPAAAAALKTETDTATISSLVENLCQAGTADAMLVLDRDLTSDDNGRRHNAIRTIRRHRIRESERQLLALLDHADYETRRLAAETLIHVGGKKACARIRVLLKDDHNGAVRASAARILGEFNDRQSVGLLEESLHDDREVRCQAVIALGLIGEQKSLPAILAQLKDPAPEVRRNACTAIGQIGNLANPDLLYALLDDRDPMVRRGAESTLKKLGHSTVGSRFLGPLRRQIRRCSGFLLPNIAAGALPVSVLATIGILLVVAGGAGYGLMRLTGIGGVGHMVPSGPLAYVRSASMNVSGDTLAVLRQRGVVEAWDLDTGELRSRFQGRSGSSQILFADNTRAILYGSDGLQEWNTRNDVYGVSVKSVPAENTAAQQLILLPDRRTAFLLNTRRVTVFDVVAGSNVRTFDVEEPLPPSTAVTPDQAVIVYGDAKGQIVFMMAKDGRKVDTIDVSGWLGEVSGIPSIRSIAFSDDSRQMAIAFSSGHLQLWDLQKFRPVSTIENCSASRVTFGSDHSVIAAGLGHVRVYRDNLKSEETIAADGMGDPMWLGLSGDGGTLAAFVDEERDVWVFDLDGMMLKHKLPGPQG